MAIYDIVILSFVTFVVSTAYTVGQNTTTAAPPLTTVAPTSSDDCTYTWIRTPGSNAPGGTPTCAGTLDECQASCIADITCTGIDYTTDGQCFLIHTGTIGIFSHSGYDHYELIRDCPGSCVPVCTAPILVQLADGSGGFNKNWTEFKNGFSDASGSNFWIGNDKLHQLTRGVTYKAHFEVQAHANSQWYVAEYNYFVVDNEAAKYTLHVTDFLGGNATEGSMSNHNGLKFSTWDQDNDSGANNCAAGTGPFENGGWWYKVYSTCTYIGINGKIGQGYAGFMWTGVGVLRASRLWLFCR